MPRTPVPTLLTTTLALLAPTLHAHADIDPLSGIDFVNIGAVGNSPWAGANLPDDFAVGRGGVGYEYRIGKTEITSAQWVEFLNAAFDRPVGDAIPHASLPDVFAATSVPVHNTGNPNARRWTVPTGSEMRGVGGIDWRTAAIYCNWLCHDKSLDRSAFLTGAYDVSTFGYQSGTAIFTDQMARTPGAQYFIPTWDEWLKAAHYDPNKSNPDGTTGGWWKYPNGTDTSPIYGVPGVGQANAGFHLTNWAELAIPVGSYPTVTTPWGLLDAAGGVTEWTESVRTISTGERYRVLDGSAWGVSSSIPGDLISARSDEYPNVTFYDYGLRIGAAVPAPSSVVLCGALALPFATRRRR